MSHQTYMNARDALASKTRFVPDFPAPGILFEDLTPVLADPEAFRLVVDELSAAAKAMGRTSSADWMHVVFFLVRRLRITRVKESSLLGRKASFLLLCILKNTRLNMVRLP